MMKRFTLFLLSMMTACALGAQVSSENYIRTRQMLNNTGTSYMDEIQYYDGLGRPYHAVDKSVQAGTTKERLGTLQEYDAMGRATFNWLPIPVTADHTAISSLKNTAQGSSGYGDSRPHAETVFEPSPLDRVQQQFGSGSAWYNGHGVTTEYLGNSITSGNVLYCKRYTVNGTAISQSTLGYSSNYLKVMKTTDEDGNVQYTFNDVIGRTLLERRMNGTEQLDTYYVYDDHSNLCFVLQPEYQTSGDLSKHAFQYRYDGRNRCYWKKLPGVEHVAYVFDDYDRMTFSQDGNQRATGKWTFYVYDKFNRLVQQGESSSQSVTSSGVYIQNYYDKYTFVGSTGFTDCRFTNDTSGYSTGSLTGTVMSVLGSNTKIYTAYYYDVKGRVIKGVRSNLLGGYDVTSTTYTFSGKPSVVTHDHTASGKTTRTEVYTYTYDHADRLSTVKHKLGSTEVTLASYTYDNKGRVATKKQHGSTNTLTYSYNIRSWLTGISSTKFTQTLGYASHYNGNISSMNWNANGTSHSYTFTYDGVNRMLNATHGTGAYTEKVTLYDKNGNIKALQRYGNGLIDNLTYTYSGNQLTRVDDATGNAAGFSNGASAANEYTYDNNGNLTKDSNKGITNIAYNCLNLPSRVTFSDGSTIVYTYAADGTKLRTVHTISGTSTQKDYCANVVYENGVQKMLLTEEGYVDLSNSSYYYYLKDHQGNNRVVVSSGGTVAEVNHYYPFGGVFASSGNMQPYKYNGKELDTKKGLNWYDYGARHYDATLGRFMTQDRFAEKYSALSPYQYGANNPISNIDVNGDSIKVSPCPSGLFDYIKQYFGFETDFQNRVNDDLKELKSKSEEAKILIEGLEKSTHIHTITIGGIMQIKPDKQVVPGESQGSTIVYNPLNEKDVNGKKRTPKVALAHELKHASDYDNGLATKEKTSNGISLMDVRAINFENKIRKITGDEKRIKYGGKNVPEELLD